VNQIPGGGSIPPAHSAPDLLAGLARWTSEGAVDRAAAERSRESWLRLQASEAAGIAEVLCDHAEAGKRVAASTLGGRRTNGTVAAIGVDFVIIRENTLGDVVIPLSQLAIVRSAPGTGGVSVDRPLNFDLTMVHALAELAADRPPVLAAAGNESARGTLEFVGADFIAVSTNAMSSSARMSNAQPTSAGASDAGSFNAGSFNDSRRTMLHVAIKAIDHLVVLAG